MTIVGSSLVFLDVCKYDLKSNGILRNPKKMQSRNELVKYLKKITSLTAMCFFSSSNT